MSKTTQKFSLPELVPIYRQMTSRAWREGRLCGELHVSNQETAIQLGALLDEDNADDYPCLVDGTGDPDKVKVGDVFGLAFGPIRSGEGRVVENIESLLRDKQVAAGVTSEHVRPWYVFGLDTASWEPDKELNRRLRTVHRLVKLLESSAAIFDERNTTLVFLRDGRFDVPVRYSDLALMQFDEDVAEKLIAELELADGHSAQRREISATAVCELLASVPVQDRFSTILMKLPELHQRFIDGYRLFASAFSYEKLRDQAEALRIEYSGKIHKTLSDIQGQLLGIPISTIVVATQFKEVQEISGQFWVNLAVLAGAIIFGFLLVVAVINQQHTLEVIEQEITRHESVLRKEHADIAGRLANVFTSLRGRMQWHRIALWVAAGVCGFGVLIGSASFWMLSRTAF
jgi:hypothetical protein